MVGSAVDEPVDNAAVGRPLARFLPFDWPDRLARAAAAKDWQGIDRLTDQLAQRYPHLVRRRCDGSRFESAALARQVTC